MEYQIQRLTPENYNKLNNIWNMSEKPQLSKKWYQELKNGNRIIFAYLENGSILVKAIWFLTQKTPIIPLKTNVSIFHGCW